MKKRIQWIDWATLVGIVASVGFILWVIATHYFAEYRDFGQVGIFYDWLEPKITFDGFLGIAITLLIYFIGRQDGYRQQQMADSEADKRARGILKSVVLELTRMKPFCRNIQNYTPRVISELYHYADDVPPVLFTDIDKTYDMYFGLWNDQNDEVDFLAAADYTVDSIKLYLDNGYVEKTSFWDTYGFWKATVRRNPILTEDKAVNERFERHHKKAHELVSSRGY